MFYNNFGVYAIKIINYYVVYLNTVKPNILQ